MWKEFLWKLIITERNAFFPDIKRCFKAIVQELLALVPRMEKASLSLLTRKVQSIYKIIIVLQLLSELRLQSNLFAPNLKKDFCSQLKFVHGRKTALPYSWVERICISQISEGWAWRYKVLGQVWGCRYKGSLYKFVGSSPQVGIHKKTEKPVRKARELLWVVQAWTVSHCCGKALNSPRHFHP